MDAGEINGLVLVDKPSGPSSREVLDDLEARLAVGPLGHAGTLDPLASGLLVVLVGRARRLQEMFMGSRKIYEASLRLGATSETLDGEGPVTTTGNPLPDLPAVLAEGLLDRFVGDIDQQPPAHSALRVGGRRAYELARAGKAPALAPRRVHVSSIVLKDASGDRLSIEVTCGKGTYIRSLARDIGEALGCGAYLEQLRRTRSGTLSVERARMPAAVTASDIRGLADVLDEYPRFDVTPSQARDLLQGKPLAGAPSLPPHPPSFAWCDGVVVCRLKLLPEGSVRSELRLAPADWPRG
jgi:tRNA pseudouridine55 synthase